MNQFNLGAKEANRIINVLGAGAKVGAGEIPYLTEVLEKSGTTANLMGISIEQMTGVIEGIAPKFAVSRRAGTSLDRVLLKMGESGIGVTGGVFNLTRGLDELAVRFKSGETSVDLFGLEHAKMGEVLVMNRELIKEYTTAVTGTSIAFEQAGKNTDNMAAKLAQAKNKVTLMYMEIGEKLAPAVIFSTNGLNILLRTLMRLPKIISDNRVAITLLVGALLTYNAVLLKNLVLSGYRLIADKLSFKSAALQILMTQAQAAQTARLTVVQRLAVVTQWAINAAMAANPVTMVVGALTALVATLMVYNRHSKAHLENEARKKEITDSLSEANGDLSASYSMLVEDQDKLNQMSMDQKRNLADELAATILLAEATYDLQKSKIGELRAENSKLTPWQFLTTWDNEKRLEKAKANGRKFVESMVEGLNKIGDKEAALTEKQKELNEVLTAESRADRIGVDTVVQLEAKVELYQLSLRNLKKGTEEYIRVLAKLRKAEDELDKAKDIRIQSKEVAFERDSALADIIKAHEKEVLRIKTEYNLGLQDKEDYDLAILTEDINFQRLSIVRLKKFGQDTIDEETKIQDDIRQIHEDALKEKEELEKKKIASMKMWDEVQREFEEDELSGMFFDQDMKDNVKDYIDWFNTTQEGQREALKLDLDLRLITQKQYYQRLKALDKEAAEAKIQNLEMWAKAATGFVDVVGTYIEIAKQQELQAAGDNDKKKEAIEKKYAKRQKSIAIAQTIIEGAVEIARVNSNAGVNADLSQTLRTILTALAIARTVGTVALIASTEYAKGKYPVKGKNDGRTYQTALMGPVKTGYYPKPTLGLFSEREPEIVIDGPTTRNIKTNFPEILSAINGARVNQYASGKYPDILSTTGVSSEVVLSLLQENILMMRQVITSHETPGTVSFSSIRTSQTQFDKIKAKTTVA